MPDDLLLGKLPLSLAIKAAPPLFHWATARWRRSNVAARAVPGEGFTLLWEPESYAQLAVRNRGQFTNRCTVRLESLCSVLNGQLISERLQPRPLRWSSRETAAYGEFKEFIDLPNDDLDHYLDVAAVAADSADHFVIVSANPADRPAFGPGWYQLRLAVTSVSEKPNTKRLKYLLGLHPRTGSIPAPLELYDWHRRGDRLVQNARFRQLIRRRVVPTT